MANKARATPETGIGVAVSNGNEPEVPVITAACRFIDDSRSASIRKIV